MRTFLLVAAACFALAKGCENISNEYYKEIGCKPRKMGPDGCPVSYDCSMISQRSTTKCHYKGKEYDQGFTLEQENSSPCLVQCRCAPSYTDNKIQFKCINVECPEHFGGPKPPNCYRTYKHDSCCSTEEICHSDQTPEQKTAKPVCAYKSDKFQIGEKFYPDETCMTCICQEGFNGSLVEPFCKKISCDLELHYGDYISEGCVPVFINGGCCPIGWRCPDKSDSVITAVSGKSESADSNPSDPELQCQFGDIKMQIGDKLSVSSEWENTECMCKIPPHPICMQTIQSHW